VDLEVFRPGGARGDFFLFVGRFRAYKGIPVLLEAWRAMGGRRLLMVGSGPLSEYASRNAPRGVELLGEVGEEKLLELYRSAICLLLPSTARSEAFGMVQLEAMACGTPVISTALPTGVPWVNRHGETGLVVPPGDPGALAAAAGAMLDGPTRAGLAGGALARARELSFERHMTALLEVYERVARGRG
jgi:rhamnosyl/mannosyltransferase